MPFANNNKIALFVANSTEPRALRRALSMTSPNSGIGFGSISTGRLFVLFTMQPLQTRHTVQFICINTFSITFLKSKQSAKNVSAARTVVHSVSSCPRCSLPSCGQSQAITTIARNAGPGRDVQSAKCQHFHHSGPVDTNNHRTQATVTRNKIMESDEF